ncbi:MAG: Nif3-like dinuclear metal center hexameric protein [Acidobacteriota bacterium]|nr:MAG: Nif3-like dinuclear metal center hexameric protein [Acidobacteriota bacterium]
MSSKKSPAQVSRRAFCASVPALGATLSLSASASQKKELRNTDVYEYLKSLDGGWVDWEKTVDTFKSGDPEGIVKGIAVGWMSYTESLRRAEKLGCNLFVTHEPTYYDHWDNDESFFRFKSAREKKQYIEESGVTILRCHDMWDQYPKIGIPEAWGKLLELGEPIDGAGWYYVYDGAGATAANIATGMAARLAPFGQPGVQLIGPPDIPVKRLVLGCGAITPMFEFIEKYRADMAICTDDGFTYWREGAFAVDAGFPVAIVNHPVAEENGARLLAEHLAQVFPQVPVHHVPQRCMYRLYTA